MARIYHERQLGGLCGVHCLNNLLQGPHFGPGDLAEIGVELDEQEQALIRQQSSELLGENDFKNVDTSADGGNFNIQVLIMALQRHGLRLLSSKHPEVKEQMKDPPSAAKAFLCQYRDHWFGIREVVDCWWNLNSTRKRPAMVSPFCLAAWLTQLGAEGYSIFLVTGSELPEPAKPAGEQEHNLGNFHEICELLDRGKKSGGNPLSGGQDSDDELVIPPDTYEDNIAFSSSSNWAAAADQQSRAAQILQAQKSILQELGFKEPQVCVALELGRGDSEVASEFLLNMIRIDPVVEIDAEAWAQELQDCVMSMDQSLAHFDILAQGLLKMAALLSCERELQRTAYEYIHLHTLLVHFQSIRQSRSHRWPAEIVLAAEAAAEHLSAAVRQQEGMQGQREEANVEYEEADDDAICGYTCSVCENQ